MRAAILIAVLCSPLVAGTTDDAVPDARFIEYGQSFSTYTAKIAGTNADSQRASASCTLISPVWAVTAAHVVRGLTDIVVTSGTLSRAVATVVIHPEWRSDVHGLHDIALVRCIGPLELAFFPSLSDGTEHVGQVVSIAGYGLHGRLTEGHTNHDGRLRAGTQTIERFDRSLIVCHAQCGTSPLELCISPGDSGGPLFAGGRLAGVNSFTMARKGTTLRSRQGEETAHTRVSLYREWIRGVMQ